MQHRPPAAHLVASTPDEVEAQFYEALREADLDKLMAVWADDDEIVCVHPGGPRIVGPVAIRAAFEAIFANGRIDLSIERVRRVHGLEAAMHSLVERILLRTAEGTQTGHVLATNVYLRTAQGWRLIAHHASPGTADAPPEVAEAPTVLH
ncbi:MAG: nuclear transport factor 2 family protein [Burkholderiaceae bacterium]|nr:nuclear transport factor 2 family protein [Burkholderiaceae bacterium]